MEFSLKSDAEFTFPSRFQARINFILFFCDIPVSNHNSYKDSPWRLGAAFKKISQSQCPSYSLQISNSLFRLLIEI